MERSQEEKNALGQLAEMLLKRYPNSNEIPLTITTTFRMPVDALAWLGAFAKHSRESRNAVCVQTVLAGIQEVMAKLDDDTRRRIEALRLEELDRLVSSKGKSIEGDLFQRKG